MASEIKKMTNQAAIGSAKRRQATREEETSSSSSLRLLGDTYAHACFLFFLHANGSDIHQELREREMISAIRKEKLEFLETNFPKAISVVASVAFRSKLYKVNRERERLSIKKAQADMKRCFYQACNGLLSIIEENHLECSDCGSRFCSFCEKAICCGAASGESGTDQVQGRPEQRSEQWSEQRSEQRSEQQRRHVCKEEDLQSKALVGGLIRCPGCRVAIFKDVGCDFITCSICSINFHYKTGEITKQGSSAHNKKIAPKFGGDGDARKLSRLYFKDIIALPSPPLPNGDDDGQQQQRPSSISLLEHFENKKPRVIPKGAILKPLRVHLQAVSSQSAANVCTPNLIKTSASDGAAGRRRRDAAMPQITVGSQIGHLLELYTRKKYEKKRYMEWMTKIEECILQGDASRAHLRSVIEDALTATAGSTGCCV